MTGIFGEHVSRAASNKLKAVDSDVSNDGGRFTVDGAAANSPLMN